ncbi:protein of unknown function [Vibrio tapetis subsp. tapetis]|uniref:Uncharacterized protein n=1 Tax=Vibrio tapetis subsp. tapetis TaxID=1671868 RepID=A0A2N8ZNK0_9VIBR|nr:protein of unknown function [Vibrio tapetis subsp. tapetis]
MVWQVFSGQLFCTSSSTQTPFCFKLHRFSVVVQSLGSGLQVSVVLHSWLIWYFQQGNVVGIPLTIRVSSPSMQVSLMGLQALINVHCGDQLKVFLMQLPPEREKPVWQVSVAGMVSLTSPQISQVVDQPLCRPPRQS